MHGLDGSGESGVDDEVVLWDRVRPGAGQGRRGRQDVRLGGGAATIRQCLSAGLIDEVHLAISPVLLGQGEARFAGLDRRALGYACTRHVRGERAVARVFLEKRK